MPSELNIQKSLMLQVWIELLRGPSLQPLFLHCAEQVHSQVRVHQLGHVLRSLPGDLHRSLGDLRLLPAARHCRPAAGREGQQTPMHLPMLGQGGPVDPPGRYSGRHDLGLHSKTFTEGRHS